MTNLARLTPHILNQIRIGEWDRKAKLLGLVATRTEDEGTWVELGLRELVAMGRTLEEARWDRVVLQELAGKHRILSRAPTGGQHGDLYRIRGDRLSQLEGWRHVPWSSSARYAIRALRAIEAGVDPEPWTVEAGQRPLLSAVPSPNDGSQGWKSPGQDLQSPHAAPEAPHAAPDSEALTSTPTARCSAEPASSTQCLWGSKEPSSLLGEERGAEDGAATKPGRLAQALSRATGRPVYGALAARLNRLEEGQDDATVGMLERRCQGHGHTRVLTVAIADLEACVTHDGRASAESVAQRVLTLRRLVATFQDSDPDHADELRAELAALEQER